VGVVSVAAAGPRLPQQARSSPPERRTTVRCRIHRGTTGFGAPRPVGPGLIRDPIVLRSQERVWLQERAPEISTGSCLGSPTW
jgi:hypothetical protein